MSILASSIALFAATVTADPAPAPQPAPAATPAAKWTERIELHGFVDVYYAYNWNRPGDDDCEGNFIPGTGTTAKYHNQFDLNLAQIEASMKPEPVGFYLAGVYGTGTQVLHFGEPRGDADLDEVSWTDMIYRATVAAKLPLGRGLLVEAGIMPSHIGFETFYSKDNWNYARGGWATSRRTIKPAPRPATTSPTRSHPRSTS